MISKNTNLNENLKHVLRVLMRMLDMFFENTYLKEYP